MLCTLNRLHYNVNITFICPGRPKKFTRLISLQCLLYCGGLKPNPQYLQGYSYN